MFTIAGGIRATALLLIAGCLPALGGNIPAGFAGHSSCKTYFSVTWFADNNVDYIYGFTPNQLRWWSKKGHKISSDTLCYMEPTPAEKKTGIFNRPELPDSWVKDFHWVQFSRSFRSLKEQRTVTSTSTHDEPISGTVTDRNGNEVGTLSGKQTVTDTSTYPVTTNISRSDVYVDVVRFGSPNIEFQRVETRTDESGPGASAWAIIAASFTNPECHALQDAVKFLSGKVK